MRSRTLLPVILSLFMAAGGVTAAPKQAGLEERVARMERLLESRGLLEMLEQLEQLQNEVRQLRGEVEVQGNELEGLQRRQRELYLDIDRRLHRAESAGAAPVTPPVATQPPGAAGTLPAAPAPAPAPAASNADPAKEREAYEHALDVLREGRYDQAAKSFRAFRTDYPDSRYNANAQYWLGEAFYVTRKFKMALAEFQKVIQEFPASPKVADARLKVGFIHYELEQWADARAALEQVVSAYPDSTAARLANNRLERLAAEGR